MAKSNIGIAQDLNELVDGFYKEIQSKSDEYQKTNLRLSLVKGKYGKGQLNEHQQREINSLETDVKEIRIEIESEISPFTSQVMPIINELYASSISAVGAKMIDDVVQLVGYLNNTSLENLDEISREIMLASSILLRQYQSDEARTPRVFAKKPTAVEADLAQGQANINEVADILGLVLKAEEAFRNKIGLMSKTRLNAFYKIENQRLDLLTSIVPQLKFVYQYLKSDNIDPSKLSELIGEIIAVMQKAKDLPSMDIPIFMTSGITRLFNFSWVSESIKDIVNNLVAAHYDKILVSITESLKWIKYIQDNGISEANKITDYYLQQIIEENKSNIGYFSQGITSFFLKNKALTQSMPKALYDAVLTVKTPPTVTGKDEEKIWLDYKTWYDKLEDAIRDLIDFVKMYHSIKALYPFTIALRAVDKRGKDIDNQAYVRSMQTLLNEVLDGPKPMPTSKKNLVAKLFNYYPEDERIARAYYRLFGV